MKLNILLQGMIIGIFSIFLFIIFERITGIAVPTWLGALIIIGIIGALNKFSLVRPY